MAAGCPTVSSDGVGRLSPGLREATAGRTRRSQSLKDNTASVSPGLASQAKKPAPKFLRLDAARGFVALYVVLGHSLYDKLGPFEPAIRFGQEAVMAFFIISGFVIKWTTSNIASLTEFRSYFFKRFARIYSIWVPGVLLLVVLASMEAGRLALDPPGRFLGNALMLQDVPNMKPAVICGPLYGVSPLWTLNYEWWFYMLFPLALIFLRGPAQHHVVGVLAVASAVVYVVWPNPLSRLLVYLAIWWIGVRAACLLREKGTVTIRDMLGSILYVAACALPLLGLAWWMRSEGQPLVFGKYPLLEVRHLLGAVGLMLVAFLWRWSGWMGFRWTVGLFVVVAPISYALYFIHYNSIAHAKYFIGVGNKPLEIGLYILVTLAFCYAAEVKLYPWFRRWLERRGLIKRA